MLSYCLRLRTWHLLRQCSCKHIRNVSKQHSRTMTNMSPMRPFAGSEDPSEFKPKKAVILTKVSRYEFEKMTHANITEKQLEERLAKRGSDYNMIRHHHNVHKNMENELVRTLQERGIETRILKRFEYNDENVQWADMIITAGGDGTFLMGSSKILNRDKPIIGINTDPTKSEGYLCLPKHYSFNMKEGFDSLLNGKFWWFFRMRLRITLIGDPVKISEPPVELHNQQLQYPEYRFMDLMTENGTTDHPFREPLEDEEKAKSMSLPILALNEVYIGESLSSRVSYLDIQVDKHPSYKSRNSGLCISTGTGSTSWTFNINKLTYQSVEKLLKMTFETTRFPLNWKDPRLVEAVAQKFNNELVFDPEMQLMCYTVRDPVTQGIFPSATTLEGKPRGKARRISVKSRCFDACLVIDGSLSYRFNDGTKAIIEILEEDALRTVHLYSGL